MEIINKILDFVIFRMGSHELRVYSLIIVFFLFLITRLLIWIIKIGFFRKRMHRKLDKSHAYSLYQITRYLLWIISISLMLETLGISLTVLLAGSAALLVGVGLGLQQTFNDFISGIILLIEGTTKMGDVLEIDGDVVMIQKIGLRTSKGLNRDDIIVIIPNSHITTNKVINWSHQSKKTRFRINVGVAYGSNVDLVIKLLEDSASEHPDIMDKNLIDARLADFGNSSLDFQLLFYSDNVFRIEKVKSDIRKIINRKFIDNKIVIPFPQMDVHFKSDNLNNDEHKTESKS
jgi:small-conductance mechanosensitive channel